MKALKRTKKVKTGSLMMAGLFLLIIIHLLFYPSGQLTAQNERWTAVTHDKTNFPLVGKHRSVPCADCHINGVMQGTPTDCEVCHWNRKQDDRYRLQLGNHCEECHTPFDWKIIKPGVWEHEKVTGFRLEGIHKTMDCFQCHKNNMLTNQPDDCFSCHQEEYREAREPDHSAAGFPTDCKVCHHSMITWRGAAFDHSTFVLRGIHKTTGCAECHKSTIYSGLSSDCAACHMEDYNNAKEPDHKNAGFPTDCTACHGIEALSWQGAVFEHTRFQLKGNHVTAACSACHQNGVYIGTPSECASCHIDDYNNTTNPNHQQAGYSTSCENCHGSGAVTWQGAVFQHTTFPLKGKHQTTACADCHKNGVYAGTPSNCDDCHMGDYNATQNPNHQQAGYSTDCASCHGSGAVTWQGAASSHSVFPLKGKHKTAACTDCHKNGVYLGTPSECADCHLDDYNDTTNPNHKQAGYSTNCENCHGSDALTWLGAVSDHSSFPLKGKHKTAACADCHKNGVYTGTPSECVDCHLSDYNNTTNPNHQQAGYPTNCESCHGSDAQTWLGAVSDHSAFPLNGKHKTAACDACHKNGVYTGTPSECVDCHLSDYNNTTSPNHQQAGFPTDCVSCHGSAAETWSGATFDHNQYWPLLGAHKTLECNVCHSAGYNLPKDCYGCHKQDYENTKSPNHVSAGFPTTCDSCHFSNHVSWSQAVFNHKFPIYSGNHRNIACTDCHLTANYAQFSCIDCHEHSKSNMDKEHDDVRGYSYNSQACYGCHPDGRAED
jgi:hypothetical protein